MNLLRLFVDTIRPGRPEFKAHLTMIEEEQAKLVRALHLLEQPATRDVKAATDSAAEFH